jgi:hypothetical protein
MILAEKLSYGLDFKLNKLSTNEHQQIPVEDKVIALNSAQIKLIKQKVDGNNLYKIGLDGFKKRYQDLQFLIENPEDHPLNVILTDTYLNKYIADITEISPKFMFYVDSYMIADKGECKDRVLYSNGDLVKHADITTLLLNTNYKPSFEYQEIIVDISSDELHYYTDGTFTPKKVYLTYIRYPQEIDLAGYVKFDDTDSANVNCELEDYLEDELLDLAVESLAMYTENQSAAVNADKRIKDNE